MEIAYKGKKDLLQELEVYHEMILKKIEQLDLISALKKTKSAITLIQENKEYFDLDDELSIFIQLNNKVIEEKEYQRDRLMRRYTNLLEENLNENNIENFLKLLAMLKEEVDECNTKFGLYDIQENINNYFQCIKKMYIILNSYKILEYRKASKEILKFAQEIKKVDFKNLKGLTLTLYRNLITEKLKSLSERNNYITIANLSQELGISPNNLTKIISLITENAGNPIKRFDTKSQLIIFK